MSRPLVRLAAHFAPAVDGGSSVFMSSFPKDLALVAEGPRVGRRYGDVITSVSRRADARGSWRGGGECTVTAAPPVFPALACGGSVERRPEGPAGRWSSLLATATRLRMVALHSSSFSATGGKSRSSCARAKASAGVGGGDSSVDHGALRLLTMLEGAPLRPSGCVPFLPALRRAC